MNKNTINYLLLTFGVVILIIGIIQFGLNNTNIWAAIFILSGIFIVSKILRKTKDLPSRAFKERLKDKD